MYAHKVNFFCAHSGLASLLHLNKGFVTVPLPVSFRKLAERGHMPKNLVYGLLYIDF